MARRSVVARALPGYVPGGQWLLCREERNGHRGPDALLMAWRCPSRLTDEVLNPHREGALVRNWSEDIGRFSEKLYVVLSPGDQGPLELGKGSCIHFLSCCNRVPHTGWLETTEFCFSHVLEVRS